MTIKCLIGTLALIGMVAVDLPAFAQSPDAGHAIKLPAGDPGAGPLPMRRSACYIARHDKRGTPCPEPALAGAGANIADRVAAHLARAVFDIEMQEPDKALKEVDAAIALDGENIDARHLAARISLSKFDIDRAEREIVVARRLAPHDPRIGITYADVLVGRRANREAVGVLNQIIHEHPNDLFARDKRATLFTYLGECCSPGNYPVALNDYNYMIQHGAPDATLLARRAGVLVAIGRLEPAVSDLTEALGLSPDNALMLKLRAEAYAALGKDDLAVKDYDALLAEAAPGVPLHVLPYDMRAKVLVARGFSLVQLKRFGDAARDVIAAISVGGKPAILRAQVLLRRHGFPDVPIDGEASEKLQQALTACFGLKSCYQPVMRAI